MNSQKHHPFVEDFGSISIVDGTLCYISDFYPHWKLPLSDIVVLGEYTTEDGPHAADHFFVVLSQDQTVNECPVDATDFVETCQALSAHFHAEITVALRFETTFKSRVIWPCKVRNLVLYISQPDTDTPWKRILNLIGCGYIHLALEPKIAAMFRQPAAEPDVQE